MSGIGVRVRKIVSKHLGVEEGEVTDDANINDDLGADSLAAVELVMAFEEEFGVDIPDEAVEKIETIEDAISLIGELSGD